MRLLRPLLLVVLLMLGQACLAAPDPAHAGLDALLRRHVAWNAAGVGTTVSYAGIARERAELRRVLEGYSAVTRAEYDAMPRDERLAFLINAYNAWTLELVLTKYPDLKSIRDLGSLIQSPWKKRFFMLLGESRSLDDLEHGLIRNHYVGRTFINPTQALRVAKVRIKFNPVRETRLSSSSGVSSPIQSRP